VAQVVDGTLPDNVVALTSLDRSWRSVWPPDAR
jgi:hypothetical protein